jgi:hypothetical protein
MQQKHPMLCALHGVQMIAERETCVEATLSLSLRGKLVRDDGRMIQLAYKVLCHCSLLNVIPFASI